MLKQLELETLVGPVCEIKRIKIFQRAIEKKASAFLTFKTAEMAKRVMAYLKQRGDALFADDGTGTSNKGIGLEYPARVGSMVQNQVIHVPADAQWESSATTTTSQLVEPTGTLSKKARKLAAAENRIVYIRNLEISTHELTALMATHGLVKSMHLVVKPDQTKTCFIQFGTSQGAGAAIASKSGGCTLPRHKRVVLPMSPSLRATSQQLRQYFERVAEIKQIQITDSEDTEGGVVYMVEFVTAVGAAKAIVHAREHPFGSVGCIMADYAPSVNREEEDPAANANVDSVAVAPAAEPQATERQATDANRVDAQSMEGAKQVDHEGEPAVDAADSCASDLERVAI